MQLVVVEETAVSRKGNELTVGKAAGSGAAEARAPDPAEVEPARIDVLIPVFNGQDTIRQAVHSIQEQTFRNITIIVVDDGSTDATASILADMALGDPRLRIIKQANQGIVAALNHGLKCGDAPFVARHDADDLAYPHRFDTQIAHLQANPDCVALSGRARHVDWHSRPLGTVSRFKRPGEADPSWAPAREPYLLHPFLMMRRGAVERIGGYRPVHHAEDSDLYWRLREHGRLDNLEEVLGDYRMHADSISSASLHNGRIMAVSSQLSALSTLRRQSGRPDLVFRDADMPAYRSASSLDALMRVRAAELDHREAQHLELAAATKLLELASYRPYELALADCAFIHRAVHRHLRALPAANRTVVVESLVMSAVRLLQHAKIREALALLPLRLFPVAMLRLLFRLGLPDPLRQAIKRMRGRTMAAA